MIQGKSVVDRDKAAYGGTLCFYSCKIAFILGTIVVCTLRIRHRIGLYKIL